MLESYEHVVESYKNVLGVNCNCVRKAERIEKIWELLAFLSFHISLPFEAWQHFEVFSLFLFELLLLRFNQFQVHSCLAGGSLNQLGSHFEASGSRLPQQKYEKTKILIKTIRRRNKLCLVLANMKKKGGLRGDGGKLMKAEGKVFVKTIFRDNLDLLPLPYHASGSIQLENYTSPPLLSLFLTFIRCYHDPRQ